MWAELLQHLARPWRLSPALGGNLSLVPVISIASDLYQNMIHELSNNRSGVHAKRR